MTYTTKKITTATTCFYCKTKLSWRNQNDPSRATIDHVIPKSKGGSDEESNLVICCRGCNGKKGDLTMEEFLEINSVLSFKRKMICWKS